MKKSIIFLMLLVGISVPLFSQPYYSSIGLRIGEPSALTGKFFFNDMVALEAMAGKGMLFSKLDFLGNPEPSAHSAIFVGANFHYQIELGNGGMYAYFGGGPSADIGSGFLQVYAGVAVGFEYVADRAPFMLFLDLIPAYAVIKESGYQQSGSVIRRGYNSSIFPRGGLGARYYF